MKRDLFILVSLLGVCLLAADPVRAGFRDENLLMPLPNSYVVGFHNKSQDMLIVEWVPKGQTVDNWTDMVTMQTFYRRTDLKPADFERKMVSDWKAACPGTSYQPIKSGTERGYTFSFWLLYCEKVSGTGQSEFTFMKAIQGNDAFYSVQKAFKAPPPEAEVVNWSKFMSKVVVCDTRLADRSCPKTN